MTRSMEDFITTRSETTDADIRIAVPVFLPGYSAIGKFGGDGTEGAAALLTTLYSVPNQVFRIVKRTIDKALNPGQSVREAARFRNFEIVVTSDELQFCPASPLLLKARPPVWNQPLAETVVSFESVSNGMARFVVDGDVWHVHPEYVGDVRWALRRIADENPAYDITFTSAN